MAVVFEKTVVLAGHGRKLFAREFLRLWDIPGLIEDDIQSVTVSLHTRAAGNRQKVRVEGSYDEFPQLANSSTVDGRYVCDYSEWDASLARLIGRTLYMQVEYLER